MAAGERCKLVLDGLFVNCKISVNAPDRCGHGQDESMIQAMATWVVRGQPSLETVLEHSLSRHSLDDRAGGLAPYGRSGVLVDHCPLPARGAGRGHPGRRRRLGHFNSYGSDRTQLAGLPRRPEVLGHPAVRQDARLHAGRPVSGARQRRRHPALRGRSGR